MDAASITKIEKGVERSASALFGLACGYAAYAWLAGRTQEPILGLEAATAFALGYLLSLRGLSSIQPEPRKVPVSIFDVRDVEPMAPVERPLLERVRPAAERPIPEEAETVVEAPTLGEPEVEVRPELEVDPIAYTPGAEEFFEPAAIEPAEPAAPDPVAPGEAFGAADSTQLELTDTVEPEIDTPVVPFAPEVGAHEAPQDARVVHLFDPASMPTPEEMIARIDRHLESQPSAAQSADAAQALHEALAELRRSIR